MRLSKKALYSLVLMGAVTLVGCNDNGESSAEDQTGNSNSEEEITLRVMTWNDNPEGNRAEQEVFDAFTEENPHITIEQVSATYGEYNERVLTMAAGGNLPDLIWVQPAGFATFVNNGLIMDLSEQVDNLDLDELQPGVIELGQVDGTQYGMIRDRSTVQMGYNKDLFDEAGIDYPEDDWTMEEFLEIAQQLTVVEGDRTTQFGIENFYLKELLTAYGTNILDPETAEVTLDDPVTIEAIEFSQALINEYNVQPTGAQQEGLSNLFLSGVAAMRMTGPWDWVEYETNADFDFDVVPLPAGSDQGNLSPAAFLPISISENTDYPEEAWELLEFLTYGGGQDIQAEITSAVPVVNRATDDVLSLAGAPDNAVSLVNQLEDGSIVPNTPYHPDVPEIENRVTSVVETLNLNNTPVEEPIQTLADEIRSDFDVE
ncbi:ABC transporter substrate-binding protein [Alkalibacterium pelagium]|uniref:Carbohydrate ABC transporter substrate-binding protein, CUT1 family n=1 Tax=Alkalibacterium pelagium TaxID=426702 RepID=A0A1H7IF52_9LACT|nr:sugar ABC transporter substrate-binding protein [Alkalibacterium pelagium]GEN50068.1 sugar ABC transporter substrate-binding protein [Alkalibacterium pelagium]SEK61193.1 carbohydrate ABC transporter substrate-binding protein, CUT1 family [Alkalibacterium pelagium]